MTQTRPHGDPDLTRLLRDWIPAQRWFAGKGRTIRDVGVVSDTTLVGGATATGPILRHLVVCVEHGDGVDFYQLLLGLRTELPHRLQHAAIGRVGDLGQHAYDAAHDIDLTAWMLDRFAATDTAGPLGFHQIEGAEVPTGLDSMVLGSDQSNTSLVYGDKLIFKLFRRLEPGLNPDLEVTRALHQAGSRHVAEPRAWYEMSFEGSETTLGVVQSYLPTASDGWELAKISVRDLYAEGDLHADEVGGDFAGESYRLGVATAEVHADLARMLPTDTMGDQDLAELAKSMTQRLDEAVVAVGELERYAPTLQVIYDELGRTRAPVRVQRVHGDYHLGQVLRTPTDWVLIDFEGEPARPMAERRTLHTPLRDVAAMLRSFDYVARHMLAELYSYDPQHEYRAIEWAARNRGAFCDGYAEASGHDPRADGVLLRALETDKAVYEVVYEARNRPGWLHIPLSAIERLCEQ